VSFYTFDKSKRLAFSVGCLLVASHIIEALLTQGFFYLRVSCLIDFFAIAFELTIKG
jgi:hypothetical protein